MTIKGQSITPSTWVPLGITCSIIIAAMGLTYRATTAWNKQAYEFKQLKKEVTGTINRIDDDLEHRTRARWTSNMEHAAWEEFLRRNPSIQLKIPDTHSIKKRLEP